MDAALDTSPLDALRQECLACTACGLCETRTRMVFGDGNPQSGLMFIGEGPGEKEDQTGIPFVGPAGQLLSDMLEIIDLDRSRYYICNIVKCRPPNNRDPRKEEQEACRCWLNRQIELINPKIVVCLGRISACALIREDYKITREHGTWVNIDGRDYTAMYHPSALLRDPYRRPESFEDLIKIREKLKERGIYA